jgi:hypothetical protein
MGPGPHHGSGARTLALKHYRKSSALTGLIDYDCRGRSLTVDSVASLDKHGAS